MTLAVQNATIVLVHGAWADGYCWSNVILGLRAQGLKVIAAPIPLTSLTDDAAAVRRVIERTAGPVILAGHAYGGAVIGAVHHERIESLVYIAALAPDENETVADVFYRTAPHPSAPQLAPDADGLIWMPEEGFGHAVAHNASPDQLAIGAAVQRPISVKCLQEKAPVPGWRTTFSWYFVAEEDRMITPETQRFMAGRMSANVRSHNVDHTPMYTAPELVVDLILEAANKLPSATLAGRNGSGTTTEGNG
jgi:pimeloyl-ACP methyl ester carboxylesterase